MHIVFSVAGAEKKFNAQKYTNHLVLEHYFDRELCGLCCACRVQFVYVVWLVRRIISCVSCNIRVT